MFESLRKIIEGMWKIILGGLAIIALAAWRIYLYMWQRYYWPEDYIFFSVVGLAIWLVALLLKFIIRNVQFLDDFFVAAWQLIKRLRSNDGEETAVFEAEEPDVIIKNNDWLRMIAENYKPGRRKPALPLGFTNKGELVEIGMTGNESHLMLTGGTGLGKGVLMNQFVIAAAMSGLYQVVIISRSAKDYVRVQDMKNIHLLTYDDPSMDDVESMRIFVDEMEFVLQSVGTEIRSRQNLCTKHKVTKIADLRVEYRPAKIVFVLEEFTETAGNIKLYGGNKKLGDYFTRIANIVRVGRSVGFHLIAINQSPVGEIPASVRREMRKATFAVDNAADSYWTTNVTGAGADNLYKYDENNPSVPGQLIYIGGNRAETLRPAFTDQKTLDTAMKIHEHDVKDAGRPTWLYGWKGEDSGVMRHNKIVAPQPTIITQDTRKAVMNGSSQPVSQTAVVAPPRPQPLTARQVRIAAGYLFDNHIGFAQYRDKKAFSKLKAQGLFVLLHSRSDMSKTDMIKFAFNGNKNDRYTDFFNQCQRYLVAIERKVRGV